QNFWCYASSYFFAIGSPEAVAGIKSIESRCCVMVEFSKRLQQAADDLQLTLTSHQQEALLAYLSQLQRWNKTYNLTAIRDPSQMLVQHVFDSMSIVMLLRAAMRDHVASGKPVSVLDVGSGAGLPGTVIAILEPEWQVSCVDAVEKKTAFI